MVIKQKQDCNHQYRQTGDNEYTCQHCGDKRGKVLISAQTRIESMRVAHDMGLAIGQDVHIPKDPFFRGLALKNRKVKFIRDLVGEFSEDELKELQG